MGILLYQHDQQLLYRSKAGNCQHCNHEDSGRCEKQCCNQRAERKDPSSLVHHSMQHPGPTVSNSTHSKSKEPHRCYHDKRYNPGDKHRPAPQNQMKDKGQGKNKITQGIKAGTKGGYCIQTPGKRAVGKIGQYAKACKDGQSSRAIRQKGYR